MHNPLTYKPFGNRAILIEWAAKIDKQIVKDIIQFKERIIDNKKEQIEDCIIGYHSLTILYLDEIEGFKVEKEVLSSIYLESSLQLETVSTLWKIPVCYEDVFGVDLDEMSNLLQLSKTSIIQLHSQAVYTVYFIGFLPGFLYLGGLDSRLTIKRKSTPRLAVAKGSVAVGGSQTGIYPMDSAGGWNVIGKTPISFFDITHKNPCFAKAGDKIQFIPISLSEFEKLEKEINCGTYQLVNYTLND